MRAPFLLGLVGCAISLVAAVDSFVGVRHLRIFLFTSAICLAPVRVFAQRDTLTHVLPDQLGISAGAVFNTHAALDLGLIWGTYDGGGSCSFPTYAGVRAGLEYRDGTHAPLVAPKVGVEANFLIIATRLSVVDYRQGTLEDPRLVPEIGLWLPPAFQLLYGWNIPLSDERVPDLLHHRLSISVNLDPSIAGRSR